MSAILPKGTTNMAADSKNPRATHPSMTGSALNSALTVGRAMLIEDPKKGVKKAAIQVMMRISRLSVAGAIFLSRPGNMDILYAIL